MNDEQKLLTVEQFNQLVYKWSQRIRLLAKNTLSTETHSSQTLSRFLTAFNDRDRESKATYKVHYYFERYGVYRAYGVGRGYVRVNGTLARGSRLVTNRELKSGTWKNKSSVIEQVRRGYTLTEVKRLKQFKVDTRTVARTPLDWIDRHIEANINELASVVQEFYGDKSLRDLLLDMDKLKINKDGK